MHALLKILFVVTLFAACQNQPAPSAPVTPGAADGAAILKHKYWVCKPFSDALAATNVSDTLNRMECTELIFTNKDTVLITACLSDAGFGIYKATSATSLDIVFDGFDGKKGTAQYDEKTGVLHLNLPEGMFTTNTIDLIAQDGLAAKVDDGTIQMARKRLAGKYALLSPKGVPGTTVALELREDGTQVGLGKFDKYEPWPSGIGGGSISNVPLNIMYLAQNNEEYAVDYPALGWQLHGDTLKLWETKNINADEMPDYKTTKLKGTYIKMK